MEAGNPMGSLKEMLLFIDRQAKREKRALLESQADVGFFNYFSFISLSWIWFTILYCLL